MSKNKQTLQWTPDLPPVQVGEVWRSKDWMRHDRYVIVVQSIEDHHYGDGEPNTRQSITEVDYNDVKVVIKAINPPKTITNYTRRMTPLEFWRFYEPLNSET